MEIEEKTPIHRTYREHINSGMAFGAQRWVTTLRRMCERLACLMVSGASTRDLGGGNVTRRHGFISLYDKNCNWLEHFGLMYGYCCTVLSENHISWVMFFLAFTSQNL